LCRQVERLDALERRGVEHRRPDELPEVQQEVQAVIDTVSGKHWPMGVLERFAFYDAARGCYATVLTGERRFYGHVLIKKGAMPPED
jgi:L-fucose mutarotase